MMRDINVCPGLLHGEGPKASESIDLGFLELWVYPLSSNVSAHDPKSMWYIFSSALGLHVAIDRGLRVSDTPLSAGKTFRFLVVIATILFAKSLGTHMKGFSFTWNLIPFFIVLIDLSATSIWSSASHASTLAPWKLSYMHLNCR